MLSVIGLPWSGFKLTTSCKYPYRFGMGISDTLVGVMKMGNIAPRAGIEHTSLAFQASVLPLHHVGSLMSSLYPCPPVYAAPCLRGQCRLLHIYNLCVNNSELNDDQKTRSLSTGNKLIQQNKHVYHKINIISG